MPEASSKPVTDRGWRRALRIRTIGASVLLLGLACTKLPTAPPREVDFEFEFQDREGTPIGNALVILDATAPPTPYHNFGARTNDAGRARFHLPEGRYEARINSPEYGPYAGRTVLPEVIVSESTGRFVYKLAGAYISGTIRNPDGVALRCELQPQ